MQRFLDKVDTASAKIEACKDDLARMNDLTRRVSGASEEKDSQKLRNKLEVLRNDFIQNISEVKEAITQIKRKSSGSTRHESYTKQQQVKSLVERTKRIIEEFSTTQSEFSAEERERLKSQYIIAKPTATKEELESVEYSESPKIPFLKSSGKSAADERKKSVKHISEGIQNVMKMTQDLNLLVHEKDRDVDKIAIQTTHAEEKAKRADSNLKAAEKYQKWSRMGRMAVYSIIIFLIVLFVFVLFGGFIFFVIIAYLNYKASRPSRASGTDGSDGPGADSSQNTFGSTLTQTIGDSLGLNNSNPPSNPG
ncbi:syntaxin 1A [Nematocida parisii]|nr:syntaxin 1A [Nematocida parisii]